jgi:hypothetical protein
MRTRSAALIIFLLAMPVFSRIINSNGGPLRSTDHRQHIGVALEMAQGGAIPPHPLFHLVLIALSGGINPLVAPGVVVFILASALGVRAWLTAELLSRECRLSAASILVLCLALALAMPLPNWWGGDIYQGNVSPNAWHNPTIVFAMPFALALFMIATRALEAPTVAKTALTGTAAALSLLAKPNYVMAFGPCFATALLQSLGVEFRAHRMRLAVLCNRVLMALGPPALVLVAQYALFSQEGGIIYAPFAVWGLYCREHYYWGSILIGTLFPLAVVACYPLEANRSRPVVLAWATLAVAIATFALFAESGDRIRHANFAWGMTLSDHVLFVVSVAFLFQQRGLVRRAICLGVLGLHASSGAVALVRYYL